MAGPFTSDELFPIVVKYTEKKLKSGNTGILIVKGEDMELRYKGCISEMQTQWAMPNWKQSNDLLRKATVFDSNAGEKMLDWPTYRSLLVENFMRSWDVTDEKGNPIPCTPDNVAKLDPSIAAALVEGFLAKTTVSEKDLGE